MDNECPHDLECYKRFDKLDIKFDELNNNLFVKKDSIMAQIIKLNVFKKIACWLISLSTITTFTLIGRLLYSHFTGD